MENTWTVAQTLGTLLDKVPWDIAEVHAGELGIAEPVAAWQGPPAVRTSIATVLSRVFRHQELRSILGAF